MDAATIRPAVAADVARLADLAQRTWLDAFGDGLRPEDRAAEVEAGRSEAYFARALSERAILVAEEGAALVGYVEFGAVSIPEVEARPGDQELDRLYVETTLQGRGLGRRLLDAALRDPRLAGARRVYLQVWEANERALRLYRAFGFETVGTTRFTVGEAPMEDLVMVLERPPR
jgi:ribosomal protein S18 acetylase RimI-like enzyme